MRALPVACFFCARFVLLSLLSTSTACGWVLVEALPLPDATTSDMAPIQADATVDQDRTVPDSSVPDSSVPDGAEVSGVDAATDMTVDGSSVGPCLPWTVATTFGPVEHLDSWSSPQSDAQPHLSADELTLYIASRRPNGTRWSIFRSTRARTTDAFSTPELLSELQPADKSGQEVSFALSPDGTMGFVSASRPIGSPGTEADIYTTQIVDGSFGPLVPLEGFNGEAAEYDPYLSADSQRLYASIAYNLRRPEVDQVIWMATRTGPVSFSAPERLALLPAEYWVDNPCELADGLTLVFSAGLPDEHDLYFSTRSSVAEAFGAPQRIDSLSTAAFESEPFVSRDGCTLYFTSDRAGTLGGHDFFRASVIR